MWDTEIGGEVLKLGTRTCPKMVPVTFLVSKLSHQAARESDRRICSASGQLQKRGNRDLLKYLLPEGRCPARNLKSSSLSPFAPLFLSPPFSVFPVCAPRPRCLSDRGLWDFRASPATSPTLSQGISPCSSNSAHFELLLTLFEDIIEVQQVAEGFEFSLAAVASCSHFIFFWELCLQIFLNCIGVSRFSWCIRSHSELQRFVKERCAQSCSQMLPLLPFRFSAPRVSSDSGLSVPVLSSHCRRFEDVLTAEAVLLKSPEVSFLLVSCCLLQRWF